MGVISLINIDEANLNKSVLKLALPAVAEQSLMMVVGVVSTIFVGRLSNEAISAVGLINTLVAFIQVLFVALSTGCTVLVARLIGEADSEKARESVKQSVILGGLASVFVSLACYIASWGMINVFYSNADPKVISMADMYFKIILYSFPLMLINIIISGTLRGAGDTRTPMLIAYVVNAVNVALSFVLIFGFDFGFIHMKGLNITGAALAVTISRALGGLLSIGVLFLPKCIIRLDLTGRFRVDNGIIQRIFKIGIPAALEQIIMQGGFLILQIVIASMGTVAIAVYQIGMSINSICYIPIWGFGIAATTLIGQSLGAKRPETAEKCGWNTLYISEGLSIILTVVVFIFAGFLMRVYSSDPEVIRTGTIAIRIFSLSQPFLTAVVVISGALRGAGDIMYVMITSFVGIWIFRILLSVGINYIFHIGIMSVWVALCFDFLARSVMYLLRYRKGRWKELRV